MFRRHFLYCSAVGFLPVRRPPAFERFQLGSHEEALRVTRVMVDRYPGILLLEAFAAAHVPQLLAVWPAAALPNGGLVELRICAEPSAHALRKAILVQHNAGAVLCLIPFSSLAARQKAWAEWQPCRGVSEIALFRRTPRVICESV